MSACIKRLLHTHDQLNQVNRIGAQILLEGRIHSDLVLFHRELLSNEALNHSSYANEHRGSLGSNERLEFLGDSVLGFVSAEYLFRTYP